MALKDEIEAHRAAIEQAKAEIDTVMDAVAPMEGERRVQQREPTKEELTYIEQRQAVIADERRAMFPKAARAIRATFNLLTERTFGIGQVTITVTQAAIITEGWQGKDGEGIHTHPGPAALALRADIVRGAGVLRKADQLHLVFEPRPVFVDGQFNARATARALIATFPEFRGRLNA